MKTPTSYYGTLVCLLTLLIMSTANPLMAQKKKVKVLTTTEADSSKAKVKVKKMIVTDIHETDDAVFISSSDDEMSLLKDIDPDQIESVDVTKDDDKGTITIKLKNGEVIKREIKNTATKGSKMHTVVVDLQDSMDEEEMAFFMVDDALTFTTDEGDVKELFPEINEDDIKEVSIEVENGKKKVVVTTKDGKKHEKVTEMKASGASWKSDDHKFYKIHTKSMSSDKKIKELEERLKRMEEKLDLLLKKIDN